jgi:hypothetical protein
MVSVSKSLCIKVSRLFWGITRLARHGVYHINGEAPVSSWKYAAFGLPGVP